MAGDYELVRAFLEFDGIDPSIVDADGMTALHLACVGASYVAHATSTGGGGSRYVKINKTKWKHL